MEKVGSDCFTEMGGGLHRKSEQIGLMEECGSRQRGEVSVRRNWAPLKLLDDWLFAQFLLR